MDVFLKTDETGRRQTALPPEKSPVFAVSVCFLVPIHQNAFYVGSAVQNFAAYQRVGQDSVVTVIKQCPSAHFQQVCHLLVGQQFIAIYGRLTLVQQLFKRSQEPVKIRMEILYPLMIFFSDFITHTL